jgi:hypothetical protein
MVIREEVVKAQVLDCSANPPNSGRIASKLDLRVDGTDLHGVQPVTGSTQLDAIDEEIIVAVSYERPVSLRGVYYRVVSAVTVDKTEAGYQAEAHPTARAGLTRDLRWVKGGPPPAAEPGWAASPAYRSPATRRAR